LSCEYEYEYDDFQFFTLISEFSQRVILLDIHIGIKCFFVG